MKNYNNRIKIYVVCCALAILALAAFAFSGIDGNFYFSPGYYVRMFKTFVVKQEFYVFSRRQSDSAPLALAQDELDYAGSIPVIVYHGIPYDDKPAKFNITTENFKDQMFTLKKAGYNAITTQDLYRYLRGEAVLPPKPILITFDDGRVDSFVLSDPIIRAVGYKATMFTIGRYGMLGERKRYYLSKDQLREMSAGGTWDIQAHSYDGHGAYPIAPNLNEGHFFSHKQWLETDGRLETDDEFVRRIRIDLETVKNGLEEITGAKVTSFAYPFGDFGQNNTNYSQAERINMEEARKLYSMVFYQNSPSQRFSSAYAAEEDSDETFFPVKRIDINPDWKGSDLLLELNKATSKRLPYRDTFRQDKGWIRLWGKMSLENGQLSLAAEDNETGATALLDGTRQWRDYSLTATVSSPNKNSAYVWVRFQDDGNNAACNFGNGFVHVEQTLDGVQNTIRGVNDPSLRVPDGEFEIEVRVAGRNVECIMNGRPIVQSSFLDPKLSTGGTGFKAWDPDPGTANLILTSLTVEKNETNP